VEELPPDIDNPELYLQTPLKNELNLGKSLVLEFAAMHLPGKYLAVEEIFRSRGAYGHFKKLLEAEELLDKWHEFERVSARAALLDWAAGEGFSLAE